jgi:hypothetical protein
MNVSSEDAAAIYARACRAWYGRRAPVVVTSKINQLRRAGDVAGVRAWTQVAVKLSDVQKKMKHRSPAGGQNGKLY